MVKMDKSYTNVLKIDWTCKSKNAKKKKKKENTNYIVIVTHKIILDTFLIRCLLCPGVHITAW